MSPQRSSLPFVQCLPSPDSISPVESVSNLWVESTEEEA